MNRLPMYFLGWFLLLRGATPVHGQVIVNLDVDLGRVPGIDVVRDEDREDAQKEMHTQLIGLFNRKFPAWTFRIGKDYPRLSIVFEPTTDSTGSDLDVRFKVERFRDDEIGLTNKGVRFTICTGGELGRKNTGDSKTLLRFLTGQFEKSLVNEWSVCQNRFREQVPVVEKVIFFVPPTGALIPFTHERYRWSRFELKARVNNAGSVTIRTEGMNQLLAAPNGPLCLVLQHRTWDWGTGHVPVPDDPGTQNRLKLLQSVKIYLTSLEPSSDPNTDTLNP